MIRMGNPLKFQPTKAFFSRPLPQTRTASARIAAAIVTQANEAGELLDVGGNEALRTALHANSPNFRATHFCTRSAGEGALLIHLHASPESVPAQVCAATWKEHAELFKHRFMRAPAAHRRNDGTMGSIPS